jgi:hypothetical protein
LLRLGRQPLDDALHRDTQDHEDLQPQQADPDGVEDALFVPDGVRLHGFEELGVCVLDEEPSLEDVYGEPEGSGTKTKKEVVSFFLVFSRIHGGLVAVAGRKKR